MYQIDAIFCVPFCGGYATLPQNYTPQTAQFIQTLSTKEQGSMKYVIEILDIVVWPIVAILALFALKPDISRLLRNIKSISHKDTTININEEMEKAAEGLGEPQENRAKQSDELSELSPRGAIIEAWLRIEAAIREFNTREGIKADTKKPFRSSDTVLHQLYYAEKFGKGTINTLVSMRKIRNEAVHLEDASINTDSARNYRALAEKVISKIQLA